MPSSETIELRHIKNVIGEKEDLPSNKQSSSIITKLKASLLKINGIPQLMHTFGITNINKTLTLTGFNGTLTSMHTDGRKLYVTTSSILNYFVLKIDIDNYVVEQSLTMPAEQTAMTSDGTFLYTISDTDIYKIRIDNFTLVSTLNNPAAVTNRCIINDGSFLYTLDDTTDDLTKISIETFTIIGSIDVTVSNSYTMCLDKRYIYTTGPNGDIKKVDIDSFTVVDTYVSGQFFLSIFSDGNNLYAGNQNGAAGGSKVYKLDITTFTELPSIQLSDATYLYKFVTDGTYLYASTGAGGSGIVVIDILSSTVVKTFNAGDRIVESDAFYLYIGDTSIIPPTIDRIYLIPTLSLSTKQINSIQKNTISTVTTGTYSHVNNTNKQDVLIFTAASQDIELRLDMTNITQSTTITEEEKIDATNYKIITQKVFPTDFDTNTKAVAFSFTQSNASYKVTFQSGTAEGSAKDVPYRYRTIPKS